MTQKKSRVEDSKESKCDFVTVFKPEIQV